MTEITVPTVIVPPVGVPLPPLTLAELRAALAKPLAALTLAAKAAKLFKLDLTPYLDLVNSLVANDDVLDVVLDVINFARAQGWNLETVKEWLDK